MDTIIRRIIDIEDKAQNIVKEAKEHQTSFDTDVEEEAVKIKNKINDDVIRKLSQIREQEARFTREKISKIEADIQMKMDKLNSACQTNKEQWINSVFTHVMR